MHKNIITFNVSPPLSAAEIPTFIKFYCANLQTFINLLIYSFIAFSNTIDKSLNLL